jgi:hypothetical protein
MSQTQSRIARQCAIDNPHKESEYKIKEETYNNAARLVAEQYRKAYVDEKVKKDE